MLAVLLASPVHMVAAALAALVGTAVPVHLAARVSYGELMHIALSTDAGHALAAEIERTLAVPPAAFSALSTAELRQLRDLLGKVLAASEAGRDRGGRVEVGAAAR